MHQYKRTAIFAAVVFLTISATLVNGLHLYYMAALLLMLPLISYLLGMSAIRGLQFSREVPGSGWEGEIAIFHLAVRSHAHLPRVFIRAADVFPEWLRLLDTEPPLFNVPAQGLVRVPYRVEMLKRGAYHIDSLHVTAMDPLGIFAFSRKIGLPAEILVYPVPQSIPDVLLSGAERYGSQELPLANMRGSGIDPDGVRDYAPGDPLRRVHWRSTARTGKLNVIEFEEAHALTTVLVLDLAQSANVGRGPDSTFEWLVRAAASIAQEAIRQNASVRLVTGETPDASAEPGRGSEHLLTILAGLARAEARESTPLSQKLAARVGMLPAGTTLIVFTSALDRDLPGVLAGYTAAGIQVELFYVDPLSFAPSMRSPAVEAQRGFMESLLVAIVKPYLLRHNDQGTIHPEPITDVRVFTRR